MEINSEDSMTQSSYIKNELRQSKKFASKHMKKIKKTKTDKDSVSVNKDKMKKSNKTVMETITVNDIYTNKNTEVCPSNDKTFVIKEINLKKKKCEIMTNEDMQYSDVYIKSPQNKRKHSKLQSEDAQDADNSIKSSKKKREQSKLQSDNAQYADDHIKSPKKKSKHSKLQSKDSQYADDHIKSPKKKRVNSKSIELMDVGQELEMKISKDANNANISALSITDSDKSATGSSSVCHLIDQMSEVAEQPTDKRRNLENDSGDDEDLIPREMVSKEDDIAAMDQHTNSSLSYDLLSNRSFDSLREHVSAVTMEGINSFGFKEMTEIQARCIPPLLDGKDLRGTAKTGSGKTLAFLIPAVELLYKLKFEPCHGTGVLVLCPTRELSMQTYGVVRTLAQPLSFTHGLIIGGANRKAEAKNLQKGVNIVVGTPGRILDHLKNTKHFQYSNLVCFILDEADRMLNIGFEEEMKAILRVLPKRRQTMLFSATRSRKTDELATLALKVSLVEIDVDSNKTAATVDQLIQSYLVCPIEQRFLILYTFIKKNKNKKIMVFFGCCDVVKFYHELLNFINVPVLSIHGKKKQNKRTETFFEFNAASSGTLLCTDVAARGWDIPEVDWIIQFDPPEDPIEYIHRVGRTARGGRPGKALLFLRDEELPFIRYLTSKKVKLSPIEVQAGKIYNVQRDLEKVMNKHYFLSLSGKKAFKSYLHTYMKHRMKDIFNVHNLDQRKVAKSFGFDNPPIIDFTLDFDKTRNDEYKKKRKMSNR